MTKPNKGKGLTLSALPFLIMAILFFFTLFIVPDLTILAFAQENKAVQPAEPEGNILNLYGRVLGSVNIEGNVSNRYGRNIGSVDSNGVILNVSKIVIGQVTPDGKVLNQAGTVMGSVNSDGAIYNVSGRKVGEVKDLEDINLIGGAARLLFLK
jgi:hypothetical protein